MLVGPRRSLASLSNAGEIYTLGTQQWLKFKAPMHFHADHKPGWFPLTGASPGRRIACVWSGRAPGMNSCGVPTRGTKRSGR